MAVREPTKQSNLRQTIARLLASGGKVCLIDNFCGRGGDEAFDRQPTIIEAATLGGFHLIFLCKGSQPC